MNNPTPIADIVAQAMQAGLSPFVDTQEALNAIRQTITAVDAKHVTFELGAAPLPHHGGLAVLVNADAAYWFAFGAVYAANGVAKQWSPAIPYAPCVGVDYQAVYQAVRGTPYVEQARGSR